MVPPVRFTDHRQDHNCSAGVVFNSGGFQRTADQNSQQRPSKIQHYDKVKKEKKFKKKRKD
jgi:hypothetical protein